MPLLLKTLRNLCIGMPCNGIPNGREIFNAVNFVLILFLIDNSKIFVKYSIYNAMYISKLSQLTDGGRRWQRYSIIYNVNTGGEEQIRCSESRMMDM